MKSVDDLRLILAALALAVEGNPQLTQIMVDLLGWVADYLKSMEPKPDREPV
jgi:hypothetical protein